VSHQQVQKSYAEKGFSMVELAIVMVILGLLIGGAVAGREVMKVSKLRAVISDLQKYKVAISAFEETYGGLPGDLRNAEDIWGSAADCVAPYGAEVGHTCDGDGNGRISNGTHTDDTEPYTAWDQLSLAKMITGAYSGAGTGTDIGVNTPESSGFEGAGYSIRYYDNAFGYTDSLNRTFDGNYMRFGRSDGSRNDAETSSLSPNDASYIDRKMDDGTPDYGDVIAGNGGGADGNCTTGASPNVEYDYANDGISCTPMFNIGDGI